jgi:hypothetical protein
MHIRQQHCIRLDRMHSILFSDQHGHYPRITIEYQPRSSVQPSHSLTCSHPFPMEHSDPSGHGIIILPSISCIGLYKKPLHMPRKFHSAGHSTSCMSAFDLPAPIKFNRVCQAQPHSMCKISSSIGQLTRIKSPHDVKVKPIGTRTVA